MVLLGVGFYFYRKNVSIEDYLLGGRGMGAWVTALSAQASDMSGWLLMALPAAVYIDVGGIGAIGEAIEAENVWASNSIYYFLLTIDYFDLGKFVAIFGIVG